MPLFVQIARAISADVRRGRLSPGTRLPGSRTLARQLGVHRNTVLAAYEELCAEGWTVTEPARGTYVNRELPEQKAAQEGSTKLAEKPCFPYPVEKFDGDGVGEAPHGVLNLSGGVPDGRLVPVDGIARAMGRVLRRRGGALLGYADPRGSLALRRQLALMLGDTRGIATHPDQLLVTRGSQMALYLVARLLLAPGKTVAIEQFGYPPAWSALRSTGARLVPVPVDDQGLQVEALRTVAESGELAAVYVTPHHQYPTTVTLSAVRRLQLLALAERYRFAVLEDDYDHEFHYRGRPVLPLASADPCGAVIYVGTLSKILAPGLRIGYVVAPQPLVEQLARLRLHIDRQGDQVGEAAIAELLEDDEVQRHARRVRRIYQERRNVLLQALAARFPGQMSFRVPDGGLAIWARIKTGVNVEAWARRTAGKGVFFAPGSRFHYRQAKQPFLRLGFAATNEQEIKRAVRIAADAAKSVGDPEVAAC